MTSESELNISLEPQLATTLAELLPVLPEPLSEQLGPILEKARLPRPAADKGDAATTAIIPYSLLSSISAWTRSKDGVSGLADCKLERGTYSMVALLAGTRTSPERKFPPPGPSVNLRQSDASRELSDRRAVTAVLNALLSILGSGVAVWWAADKLRWKDEWVSPPLHHLATPPSNERFASSQKVLLSLFAAIVVAAAEAGLFLIWNARKSPIHGISQPSKTSREPLVAPDSDGDGVQGQALTTRENAVEQTFDTASPDVQIYRTVSGLRERKANSRK